MTVSHSAALAGLIALMALPADAQPGSGTPVPDHLRALDGFLVFDLTADPSFSSKARPDTHLGWAGSAAIVAHATNGDVDEFYGGVAGRAAYFDGLNSHDVAIDYAYDEDGGLTATNKGTASYQYRYSFAERAFAFGHLESSNDEFGSYENDARAVAGLGYRVIDRTRASMSLMGGPGYRYAERSDGREFDEAGLSIGTRGYFAFSDRVYAATSNTVMVTDSDTVFISDLSLNIALSDPWSLRAGFRKEYHSNPGQTRDDTVNLLSASLVYNFN